MKCRLPLYLHNNSRGATLDDFFTAEGFGLELIASAVVIALAFAARLFGARLIRRQQWSTSDESRRWLVRLRNVTLLVAVFALLIVWANELRTAAITFLALGAAFVLATRELIMSISGSLVRAASASFSVGDRITVGSIRGVVIDHSTLTTTLLEIGPSHVRTGRVVVLPNSTFLSSPVVNESSGHEYVLHAFTVPVKRSEWRRADEVLQQAADHFAAEYVTPARTHMEARAQRYSLPMPNVEPFILAKPTGSETVEMTVRIPVAARDVWKVENDIMRAWLEASTDTTDHQPTSDESPLEDSP